MSSSSGNPRNARGRWLGTLKRLSLAVCAACFSWSGLAHAQQTGNWLYLEFSPTAQVRYVENGNVSTQPLSRKQGSRCELNTGVPLSDFLVFRSGTPVGWRPEYPYMGVNGTSKGANCVEIRSGQYIELQLGSALTLVADGGEIPQQVVEATLNMVVTKATDIVVSLFDAPGDTPALSLPPVSCPIGNCQIHVPAQANGQRWNRIRLDTVVKPTGEAGAWSLAGSEFQLVPFVKEGDLACGELDNTEGGATLRRLFNAVDATGGCTEIPYRLDFDGKTLTFLGDYSVLPEGVEPAFEFDVVSDPELVTVLGYQAVPFAPSAPNPPLVVETFVQAVPLTIQWFDDANNKYLLDFCPGQPDITEAIPPAQSVLNGLTFPAGFETNPANDMSANLDGFQYGCLIERKIEIVEQQQCGVVVPEGVTTDSICVQVRERGYLRGDYTRTRLF